MKELIINNLSKEIKGKKILVNATLTLHSGNIYGLVGDNGSGKTMLMRAISGLIVPTQGTIFYDEKQLGKDFEFPPSIGILIESPGFLLEYSHMVNLKLLVSIKGEVDRMTIIKTLQEVGLDPNLKLKVKHFSMGMRQRLGIAQAIMENPDVLILDEPFNGLDYQGVIEIRELLLKLKQQGKLIIISSHQPENIDYLCDEVFLISKGVVNKRSSSGNQT